MEFDRALLDRTLNVNIQLNDERRESVAPYVLTIISSLFTADGDGYESLRIGAIFQTLDVTSAPILSTGVVGYVHHANVIEAEEEALAEINAALEIDTANPLLLIQSAILKQRLGQIDAAHSDLLAAERIGPNTWVMPQLFIASMTEDESVLNIFNEVIEKRPDDWLLYFFRGTLYYNFGQTIPDSPALARADFERSIELGPEASFPYIYSALLALHEGRIQDAEQVIDLILTEYPDPAVMERMIRATFSNDTLSPYVITLSAFTNQTLGRQTEVITWTSTNADLFEDMADLALMQGIAYCALGDYAAAVTSFSTGLVSDPTFTLLHLLRAGARQQSGNTEGAAEDYSAVEASPQSAALAPYLAALKAGEMNCGTFLSPDNPVFGMDTSEAASTPILNNDAAPDSDPLTAVALVEAGEYMVLVADLEPLEGVAERDVARFIADDLRVTLEESVAYTQIRIRRYPAIITSAAEAEQVAETAGAAVIVWGHYTTDEIELQIQIGATESFGYNQFARDTLAKTGNVRAHLSSERQESVAVPVTGIVNLLSLADGDQFDYLLTMTMIGDLNVTSAEIVGQTPAAHLHRALIGYFDAPSAALDDFTAAITLDSGNPLLYAYRAITQIRLGDFASAKTDLQTAKRLGPEGWTTPGYFGAQESVDEGIAALSAIIESRPDDWYPQFFLGMMYYADLNDLEAAKPHLDAAIAAGPEANLPFVTAMLLALREGRIADAQEYAHIILTQFPDPDLTNRAFSALFGDSVAEEALTGEYFAVGTNIVIGQYDNVIRIVDEALAPLLASPAPPGLLGEINNGLSDIFLLQGMAYCNQHNYQDAETAYSQAIRFSQDYALAYLLRGQTRLKLLHEAGATTDFETARTLSPNADFDLWLEAAMNGEWTCANLLE